MREFASRPRELEMVKSPESYRLVNAGAIAIFGEEGSGKSNLSDTLARILNARPLQGGRLIRKALGGNHATVGYLERGLNVDQDFDQYQKEQMMQASPQNPLINESRLSGYVATQIMRENPEVKIIRINVTCPKRERIRRITKRTVENWEEKKSEVFQLLSDGKITSEEFEKKGFKLEAERREISFEQILKKETERRKKDNVQWAKAWPELIGKDVLNPGTRISGKKLWDFTVSTGKRTKQQTIEYVLNLLKENGLIEKVKTSPQKIAIFGA